MPTGHDELKRITQAIHPLPEDALLAFTGIFHPYEAGRKENITMAGQKERYLYFVTVGVQRIYEMDDAGREATILFTYPYSFGGVLDSFLLQQPSRYHYEALTASTFLRAGHSAVEQVRQAHPSIELMLNKGIAAALSGVLERLSEIQRCTAEEKLRKLMQRSPQVFRLIPQKYLASYLGIDATNLSKLINRVKL